jgi:hypothetical protein
VPADTLLDGVTRIDAINTALVHRMVHAHRITELEMARTTREGHVQTLRQLLHGEPVTVRAALDPDVPYHCVVSDISDPAVASRLEAALAARGPALCGLVDGRLAALVARLPDPSELAGGPLLVAAPAERPAGIAPLYRLGRRALRAATASGLTGLRPLTDLALVTVTEAEPELGRLLAARLLAGLDPADPFHRELAATALALLEHGGRIEPTAAVLHVHGNTVKYRLRRFQELTGGTPTAPRDAVAHSAHWWWALREWISRPRDGGMGR